MGGRSAAAEKVCVPGAIRLYGSWQDPCSFMGKTWLLCRKNGLPNGVVTRNHCMPLFPHAAHPTATPNTPPPPPPRACGGWLSGVGACQK